MVMLQSFKIDSGTIKAPIYRHHKRARNWAGIVTGKNATKEKGLVFLDSLGTLYDITPLRPNMVLEIAADVTTSSGHLWKNRLNWRVDAITDDELTVEAYPTLAKAMRAARLVAAGVLKPRTAPAPITNPEDEPII